jgi:hypothetical protein
MKQLLALLLALFLFSDAYSSTAACVYNTVMVWNCINNSANFLVRHGKVVNAAITCCFTGTGLNESNYDVTITRVFNDSRPYSIVKYYNGTNLITSITGPSTIEVNKDYDINISIYLPVNSTYSDTTLEARVDLLLDTKLGFMFNNIVNLNLRIPVNYNATILSSIAYFIKNNSLIIGVIIACSAVLAYFVISKREQL